MTNDKQVTSTPDQKDNGDTNTNVHKTDVECCGTSKTKCCCKKTKKVSFTKKQFAELKVGSWIRTTWDDEKTFCDGIVVRKDDLYIDPSAMILFPSDGTTERVYLDQIVKVGNVVAYTNTGL